MRAARLCQVSDKKLQRAIRAERLPAHGTHNRIDVRLRSLTWSTFYLDRCLDRQDRTTREPRCRIGTAGRRPERAGTTLAQGQESISRTAHGSSPAKETYDWSTAQTARTRCWLLLGTTTWLKPRCWPMWTWAAAGQTRESGRDHRWLSWSRLALDPAGKRAFHQIYHGVPPFVACKQCPH